MKVFVENLNKVRTSKNLTITEVSRLTDYSRNSINKLFSGPENHHVRLKIVVSISRALDIDFPLIFSRELKLKDYSPYNTGYTADRYLSIFVDNVKKKIAGYSQFYLRTLTGLSESTISDLLNNKTKNPRIETLELIAKGLNLSEKELFNEVN